MSESFKVIVGVLFVFGMVGYFDFGPYLTKTVLAQIQLDSESGSASVLTGKCDYLIPTSVEVVDGRLNTCANTTTTKCLAVKPGETICLQSGDRGILKIKNVAGTAQLPITIVNTGGLVNFSLTRTGTSAISIQNSRHFRLTGAGVVNLDYGIVVSKSTVYGVQMMNMTEHYEVDHIEIRNSSYGFGDFTYETCPDGQTAKENYSYDYSGDGKISTADRIQRSVQGNLHNQVYHHNFLHDLSAAGFYIGPAWYNTGFKATCSGSSFTAYPLGLAGTNIHHNKIQRVNHKAIMAKGARTACQVHHNTIYRDSIDTGSTSPGFCMSIQLAEGTISCDVFNNYIKEGNCMGIGSQEATNSKIYNNVIIRPGNWSGAKPSPDKSWGIYSMKAGNLVANNTIIEPKDDAIRFDLGTNAFIQNNLIVKSSGSFITVSSGTATVTHNLTSRSPSTLSFEDSARDLYRLTSQSPAVDQGKDLQAKGIGTDYLDHSRPYNQVYDIGAYEWFTSNSTTPTPTPSPQTSACTQDLNGDRIINISDLLIFLSEWGEQSSTEDFLRLLSAWGTVC